MSIISSLYDFFFEWIITPASVTAGTNAAWGASGLLTVILLQYLLHTHRETLSLRVRTAIKWGRGPGICYAVHRTYWNVAIWLAPAGAPFALWANTWKWVLLPVVLGMVVTSVMTILQFIPTRLRLRFGAFSAGFIGGAALLAIMLTPDHHAEGYAERNYETWYKQHPQYKPLPKELRKSYGD